MINGLDRTERRIIGVLVEKALSTPDAYPLTVNALLAGCNQKSNRDPVLDLQEFEIDGCLRSLFLKGLVVQSSREGGRATRWRHRLAEVLQIDPVDQAVLAELLLRGPQTVGELRTHTERMHRFASLEEVIAVLERLAARPEALARLLPRAPGERAPKWCHLLSGETEAAPAPTSGTSVAFADDDAQKARPSAPSVSIDEVLARLARLEDEVKRLAAALDATRTPLA